MFPWFDAVLQSEVRAMRESYAKPIDEFQGLYVSDAYVDGVLQPLNSRGSFAAPLSDFSQHLADFVSKSPRWGRVCRSLSLTHFDCAVLLLALSPEVDLKYETVYAYLNNDVSRKWPTRDLALRLFASLAGGSNAARARLGNNSPLFQYGLLKNISSGAEPPTWRGSGFVIDAIVAHALLDAPRSDIHLPGACGVSFDKVPWEEVAVSSTVQQQLTRLTNFFGRESTAERESSTQLPSAPLFIFEGRPGAEQHIAATALATALDVPTISVDLRVVPPSAERIPEAIRAAILHQILYGSVLVIDGIDSLTEREPSSFTAARTIVSSLPTVFGPTILIRDEASRRDLIEGVRTLTLHFETPSTTQRAQLWERASETYNLPISPELRNTMASRFILTPGQIRRAAQAVADNQQLSGDVEHPIAESELFEAARTQTRVALGALARRVNCVYTYDDLVLPAATAQQIREIAAAIRTRSVVYDEWEFSKRMPQGQGLKVLFSGSSGTGKTMAAAVIAREVGLDLYAIDLSGIVSKYIGETEKNLDQVFRAAHCSNSILFFDECDALFGKRSEVKDAHDRYANIEVAYLLQKMEAHEGVVILATNFSRNMDQAFARRMQYVVEFPIPDEVHRERLWRGMFPAQSPLSDDIDFSFLARHFAIAGGDIRNVALDAAFLAAQNGRVITMQHLVRAMARQVIKQGRSPSPTDFKHYYSFLSRDS